MRKTIVAFAGVAVLAAWGPAMADLGTDKKNGLAKLEAEAPGLHAQVAKLQGEYAAASLAETEAFDRMGDSARKGSSNVLGLGLDVASYKIFEAAKNNREAAGNRLNVAKEEERYVGSQIFLLRDMIAGLGCDTLTPAPPVDYGAIEQHTQQYQQSQPGSQATTSEQLVVPQGAYATPSSGFGTPETPAQTPGSQGYGPGPYDTGSPRVPHDQITVEGSIGGGTGGKSAMPGEPPKPPMEKHKKKPM